MKLHRLFFTALSLLCTATSSAHHGQDFLVVEDYHIAHPGQFHLFTNFEWESGDDDAFSLAPSLMVGLFPRVALGLETDFRDDADGDWRYESFTPMLHVQITNPESDFPIRVGFSAGYTFADGNGNHSHEAEAHHHEEHAEEHGEEHHEEEPAAEDEHFHGIHQHGTDAFVGRLVIEGDLGEKTKAVANLISLIEDGGDAHWGYAAGVRTKVAKQVAVGVEAIGDFESDGWHELVLGTYVEPMETLTFKVGIGFGLTEETPDFVLRSGLILRF